MQQLNNTFLSNRPQRPLRVLQFGGGNFLRAFTDWMIEEANRTTDFNAGVAIIKPTPRGDYHALRQQDGMFHVLLEGIKNGSFVRETTLVQCVQQVIHPYNEWDAFLASAENPDIRYIISNTTESGIEFRADDQLSDTPPASFPGKLTAWLWHRFQTFKGDAQSDCVFLPLELIEQNGEQLQKRLLQYAEHWELPAEFTSWLQTQTFCNTLVDRIVSGFPEADAEAIYQELELKDELLVKGEYYHSWVIQGPKHLEEELPFFNDNFNVKLVDDLDLYRKIKVRMLNGAHTSLVPVGYLSGVRTVGEAMQQAALRQFVEEVLLQEVLPTLDAPKEELEAFANAVLDRFSNPALHHKLIDIALNSTSKFVSRLLPTLLDYQKQTAKLPERIVFAFAALIRFYRGEWDSHPIQLRDEKERITFFSQCWEKYGHNTTLLAENILANTDIWGMNLNEIEGLTTMVSQQLEAPIAETVRMQ